jgi:hypothetical protein
LHNLIVNEKAETQQVRLFLFQGINWGLWG